MFNLARLADNFREQKIGVAKNCLSLLSQIEDFCSVERSPGLWSKSGYNYARVYICSCYHSLRKDFSEKDLVTIKRVADLVREMSRMKPEDFGGRPQKARELMTKFMNDQLPGLMEKALTKAVRESGIKLR
ncbi:MAG: hypothetical protein NTV48_03705 [Candidatus Vogelbacteria bacterium]|nr:hypothetical protein [Candidatus Vogelbacteria bacterium]